VPISIKIESTDTVGDLAREVRIRQIETLGRFDLSKLALYRVDVPGPNDAKRVEGVQVKMNTVRLAQDRLDSMTSLKSMYPSGPPELTIHIFVRLASNGEH
jgi:hypothetical protein